MSRGGKIHLPSYIAVLSVTRFKWEWGGGDSDRMDSMNNILRDVIRV